MNLLKYLTIAALLGGAEAKGTVGAYYELWSAKCKSGPNAYCDLADISPYIEYVYLSFADPQATYDPKNCSSLSTGDGKFTTSDPNVLKESLRLLRQKSREARRYIELCGSIRTRWSRS